MIPQPVASALTAIILLLSIAHVQAAVGFRQLTSVYPVAVQRGTKAVVKVRSNFTLDGTHSVFFDKPGLRMTYAEPKPVNAPLTGRGTVGTPFRFEVEVPADQEPRVYEFRVATKQAVSSVSHILVTEFPVIEELPGENGNHAVAQPVTIPAAVCGVCERIEDVDCFRFTGEAGRELTIQVYAQRVTQAIHDMVGRGGNYLMDPILTLIGPNGQVFAQNDNMIGGDAFLHVRLPDAGEYVLEVRDARYVGNERYTYCVEIADRPFVQAVFPFVVQRGTSVEAEVIGHILGGLQRTTLSAAAEETIGWKSLRIKTGSGATRPGSLGSETNPVPVLVSAHPQVVAKENKTAATATTLSLPVGVNGRLAVDETHYYSFDAVKGQFYLFEMIAHRRGLPLDGVLELFDAAGKKLAEADDGLQTKDPQLYFQAPADGKYVLAVRDLHGRGGERFLYHLKAEPSGPDFEVHGEYYYAMLAPGSRMIWFARLNRLNGFAGPVEMHVEGLPEGVTFTPVTIPAGMNQCALILSAAPDAKLNASLARVYGKGELPGPDGKPQPAIRYGRVTCELQSQGGGQSRWPINTQVVGVVEPMDLLKVEASPEEITLKPGTKSEIKVKIERNAGFTDPVTLDMAFVYFTTKFGEQLPPGVTMSPGSQLRLSGKSLEGKIILEASPKATPVERLPIAAVASVSISFSINTNYASNPIHLTILPATK